MHTDITEITEKYKNTGRDQLIPMLQDIQNKLGFLSEDSIKQVAKKLSLPASKIFGVATFYNQFRFEPKGKYHIQVCRGTACHVLGSATVLEQIEKEVGVKAGKTSKDKLFSIEIVACIGACGLAPVIAINGEFYAKVTKESVKDIIKSYRDKEEK